MKRALLVLLLAGCAWQQRSSLLRTTAASHLGCPAADLTVYTRDDLGRVKGCKREALYVLTAPQLWELESMYPTDARGIAYVPKCGAPEVINFVSGEEDISAPIADGEVTSLARKVSGRAVRYPRGAAAANIQGKVGGTCQLSASGLLSCCDLDQERALLDGEIRNTLATWRYDPARKGGLPVPVLIAVEFTFELY